LRRRICASCDTQKRGEPERMSSTSKGGGHSRTPWVEVD
jgi:hypothetical protein